MTINFTATLSKDEVVEILLANLPEGIPQAPVGHHFEVTVERYPDVSAKITLREDEVSKEEPYEEIIERIKTRDVAISASIKELTQH